MDEVLHVATTRFAISGATSPASGKNQDTWRADEFLVGVADGATPLEKDWRGDVRAFAEHALASLSTHGRQADRGMNDVFRSAIQDTAAAFPGSQPALSCGVAVIRPRGDQLELAVLGDCEIYGRLLSEKDVHLKDSRLDQLDAIASSQPSAQAEHEQLLQHRGAMNTPQGYWIFASDPEAADHVHFQRIQASTLIDLVLFTDGVRRLARAVDGDARPAHILDVCVRSRPERVLAEWREHERAAITGNDRYLKRSDDATMVVVRRT